METLANVAGYGFGILGMICLGMALFVKFLGSIAYTYQRAEAPAEAGSTGSCFFTTMMVALVTVALLFFMLAITVPNMMA